MIIGGCGPWALSFVPGAVDSESCAKAPAGGLDLTIPDGTQVAPGQEIDKRWNLENCGTSAWHDFKAEIDKLTRAGDTNAVPQTLSVPETPPGSVAELRMRFQAPDSPGCYRYTYALHNGRGQFIRGEFRFWVEIHVSPNGSILPAPGEDELALAVVPPDELGPNWVLDPQRQSTTSGEGCRRHSVYGGQYINTADFPAAVGGRKIGVRLWTYPNISAAEDGVMGGLPYGLPFFGRPEKVSGLGDGTGYRRMAPEPNGLQDPVFSYSYRIVTVVVGVGVWEGDLKCMRVECAQGTTTRPDELEVQARDFAQRQTDHLRAVLSSIGAV